MSATSFKRGTTNNSRLKKKIIVFSNWHWIIKYLYPECSKRERDLIVTEMYEDGVRFKYKWLKTIEVGI